MNRLDTVLRLHRFHRLHPLEKGGKKPVLKNWPEVEASIQDVSQWFAQGLNFGLITERAAVLDFDDKEPAAEFFRENRQHIKTIVATRRGVHFYFRNGSQIRNACGTPDVRGIGGYVVSPGSVVGGHLYRFVEGFDEIDPRKMRALRADWLPKRDSEGKPLEPLEAVGDMVYRAREYLKRLPPAISGQNGHGATMRAAGVLIQKFRLSFDQAFPLMLEYNERCEPAWSIREIRHKLESAMRKKGA